MTAKSVLESAAGGTPPGALSQAATTDDHIKAALAQLDPANDEHWTSDGKPAMAAINALLPAEITRARLEEVAPDFVRPNSGPGAGGPFTDPIGKLQARADVEALADPATLHGRIAALEEDVAFLRNQFGWPTKDA